MCKYGIIAIGYNRPESMNRLLSRLNECCYYDENVVLIISIDNSGSDNVSKVAESFRWDYGEKHVITYPERLGLRNHILKCGSYMDTYNLDAIAVFEDDVLPAISFYNFMRQAVPFYCNDTRIAGISLYSHKYNQYAGEQFCAARSGADVYFMQVAQSWGQIWMRKSWHNFIDWYKDNDEEFGSQYNIPEYVVGWPKTSWLKYHIKYCIEKGKFFVYPYESLTTCFSDLGEHFFEKNSSLFQVPLDDSPLKKYTLTSLDNSKVKYDGFYERIGVNAFLDISEPVCVNLYGTKQESLIKERYLLTKNIYKDVPIVKSFALLVKPHEENILQHIAGESIFLYDCKDITLQRADGRISLEERLFYYRRIKLKRNEMLTLLGNDIKITSKHIADRIFRLLKHNKCKKV